MTSRDFIAAEADNTDRIILYREGLFWKAYERSAFALCSQVRPLKPTRKVLKSLNGGDLISVGFPSASESSTLGGLSVIERSDDRLTVSAPRPLDEREFRVWKNAVPVKPQPVRSRTDSGAAVVGAASGSAGLVGADTTVAGVVDNPDVSGFGAACRSVLRFLFRAFRTGGHCDASSAGAAGETVESRIVRSLEEFNLADKTPMECMLFISELKNSLVERRS